MATSCDKDSLAESAKCFNCYTPTENDAVATYLLTMIAGMDADPTALLDAAKCFLCIDAKALKAMQVYLLCQIVNK